MKQDSSDSSFTHPDAAPTARSPRTWFWWFTALLIANATLAFGYHFLGWDPASDAKADAPALVIAPQSIALAPAGALVNPAANAAAAPTITQCWVWGAFSEALAQTLNDKAASAGLPAGLAQPTATTASHIILMGPYANRAALDKKVAELKRMKVNDLALTDNLSISLGIFSSESAAQNQFKALGKQGVRSAKVLRKDTLITKISLRFDALAEAQSTLLAALATDLGTLTPCP